MERLRVPYLVPVSSYSIEIAAYDPSWIEAYQQEAERLEKAIGSRVLRFEHMGSTAVPGLAAKPIIDISAAVPKLENAQDLFPTLDGLGYKPIEQTSTDRYDLWRQTADRPPTHILHFMELESDAWIRPLIFRNALRADPELRATYASLKEGLAGSYGSDIRAYGKGKTEFINNVIDSMLWTHYGGVET